METAQIINETGKLPIYQQMIIAEHIIRSIRHTEQDKTLEMAAERLYDDYKNDPELTIFTLNRYPQKCMPKQRRSGACQGKTPCT